MCFFVSRSVITDSVWICSFGTNGMWSFVVGRYDEVSGRDSDERIIVEVSCLNVNADDAAPVVVAED